MVPHRVFFFLGSEFLTVGNTKHSPPSLPLLRDGRSDEQVSGSGLSIIPCIIITSGGNPFFLACPCNEGRHGQDRVRKANGPRATTPTLAEVADYLYLGEESEAGLQDSNWRLCMAGLVQSPTADS